MLVDTSILLRTLQPRSPQHGQAAQALRQMALQGRELHLVPQVLYEIWVVVTRPAEENGLGLTVATAAEELNRLKDLFLFLPDTPAIFTTWKRLVTKHRVSGKPAHDARLVAAMEVHGLSAVLTFDMTGFSRFDIEVVNPSTLA